MPRFPFAPLLIAFVVLVASLMLVTFQVIPPTALFWVWGSAAVTVFALFMVGNRDMWTRRVGIAMLAVVALGTALAVVVTPAHAQTATGIVAPAGDTGLWAWINPYLEEGIGAVVAALAGWAFKEVATHTRIRIRADQEAQIRETMKTAAFAGAHELELFIGDHWTPAQQQALVKKMTTWAEVRAAGQLKKLGLPNFVVEAMAHKVLGQLQGFGVSSDTFDAAMGAGATFTGNPGETPALDRVVGTGGN